MPDRLERDIEDVLSKIEDFDWHRRQRQSRSRLRRRWDSRWQRMSQAIGQRLASLSAGHLMLAGFLVLLAGLVLRFKGLGAWFVVAGMIIFLVGLAWSMRAGRRGRSTGAQGAFWRDRYIAYENESAGRRLRSLFRRGRR